MNTNEIKIAVNDIRAAYKDAGDAGKDTLVALFGKDVCVAVEPSLDDYTTIKTYEDACIALGVEPLDEQALAGKVPPHIIALMKLETVSRALWGRKFQPKPDAKGSETYYYPWFALWTKAEIDGMNKEDKGALLAAGASSGASAGFGYLNTHSRSSDANAHVGFRLCQETVDAARYFGRQFVELWAEYLAFNFTVGGPYEEK